MPFSAIALAVVSTLVPAGLGIASGIEGLTGGGSGGGGLGVQPPTPADTTAQDRAAADKAAATKAAAIAAVEPQVQESTGGSLTDTGFMGLAGLLSGYPGDVGAQQSALDIFLGKPAGTPGAAPAGSGGIADPTLAAVTGSLSGADRTRSQPFDWLAMLQGGGSPTDMVGASV